MWTTFTNLDIELQRALIQISGVLIAATIAGFVAWGVHIAKVKHEDNKERIANARELKLASVFVSDQLANFIKECRWVAADDGTDEFGHPAGGGMGGYDDVYIPTTNEPNWEPSSITVQWKYLEPNLLDQIFKLSLMVNEANWRISGARLFSDPPDYEDYFHERRLRYAELGLRANYLREQVIANAGLADKGMPEMYQDAAEALSSIKSNLLEKQRLREKRRSPSIQPESFGKNEGELTVTAVVK